VKYFIIGGTTALNNACGVCGILYRKATGVVIVKLTESRLRCVT